MFLRTMPGIAALMALCAICLSAPPAQAKPASPEPSQLPGAMTSPFSASVTESEVLEGPFPADPAEPMADSDLPSEASPGPCLSTRQNVRNWLVKAKQKGVGISTYTKLYDDTEKVVKGGAPEPEVKAKVDYLCKAIAQQVKDKYSMATYKPLKRHRHPGEKFNVLLDQPKPKWVGPPIDFTTTGTIADKVFMDALMKLPEEQRVDPTIRGDLRIKRQKVKDWMDKRFEQEYYHF